jgi:hypothetical protein
MLLLFRISGSLQNFLNQPVSQGSEPVYNVPIRTVVICHFFRSPGFVTMMPCQPTPNDIPREIFVVRRATIAVQDYDCCGCCSRWEDRVVCRRHRPPTAASHRLRDSLSKTPPRRESPPVQPRRSVDAGVRGPSVPATLHHSPSLATRTAAFKAPPRRAAPTRSVSSSHAWSAREIRKPHIHRTVSV